MKRAGVRDSHGQEMVEFALTFPLMFLLLMGIFDMGRGTYYYSVVHNSAREGVRYGVIDPQDEAGIKAIIIDHAIGIVLQEDDIIVTVNEDEDTITVTVTYGFVPVTPLVAAFLGDDEITLGSEATMTIER